MQFSYFGRIRLKKIAFICVLRHFFEVPKDKPYPFGAFKKNSAFLETKKGEEQGVYPFFFAPKFTQII